MSGIEQAQEKEIGHLKSEIGHLKSEIGHLRLQVRELKAQIYGAQSERRVCEDSDGQSLLDGVAEAMIEDEPAKKEEPKGKRVKGRGAKKGPKPLPAHLRRESVSIADPDLKDLICPHDGSLMQPGFQQSIEVLCRKPAEYFVKIFSRNVFVSPAKSAPVASAWPSSVLPNARVDASIVASVLCSRFADHQPFYRQQEILRRHGVEISRTAMSGWARRFEESCVLLVKLIADKVLDSAYVQLDATPVKVLDPNRPGAAREACGWAYRSLSGLVFFEFALSKSGETPKERLKNYKGLLQTDGASNFGGAPGKEGVVHLLCWAHARRYFDKASKAGEKAADPFMESMRRIFRLEKLIRIHKVSTDKSQKARESYSIKEAEKLFAAALLWREQSPMRKTAMGRAVDYFLKRKKELLECFRHPGSRIDNNLVENAIRPLKLGLKNYLFVGHPDAGSTFACLYTLIENCRLAGANPEEYLADVIERMLDYPSSKLEDFIPQNWVELKRSKNADQ